MLKSASCDSLTSILSSNNLDHYKPYSVESGSYYGCYCENDNQSKTHCKCSAKQSKIIAQLQQDLRTAAEVGTALVERHQQLIESSERDKLAMQKEIDLLIQSLEDVRMKNDSLLQENSDLMEELQMLSSNMHESDERINSLAEALGFAKERIMRLNGFQLHSRSLESQLAAVEAARESLAEELSIAHKDRRVAEIRWRKTESVLENLVSQYEHLEGRSDNNCDDALLSSSPSMQGFVKNVLEDNAKLETITKELKKQLADNKKELELLRFSSTNGYRLGDSNSPQRKDRMLINGGGDPAAAYLTPPPSTGSRTKMPISSTMLSSPRHSRRRSSTNSRDIDSILGHRKRASLRINTPISPTHSYQNSLLESPNFDGYNCEDKVDHDLSLVTMSPSPQLRRVASHESVFSSKVDFSVAPTWNVPFKVPQVAQPTLNFESTFAGPMMSLSQDRSSSKQLLSAAVANNISKQKITTGKPSIQSETSDPIAKKSWADYLLSFKSVADEP